MYHGPIITTEKYYTERWRPSFGWTTQAVRVERMTRHVYTCDSCGQAYRLPVQAEDAFYCRTPGCAAEVSIAVPTAKEVSRARP